MYGKTLGFVKTSAVVLRSYISLGCSFYDYTDARKDFMLPRPLQLRSYVYCQHLSIIASLSHTGARQTAFALRFLCFLIR